MSLLTKASLVITPNAYKASKLYSVIPNTTLGDMDVTRATTATRVNAQGLIEIVGLNIPRIDYTNGSCPAILIEPQRTNLLTYSNDFSNASWLKDGITVIPNSVISPDGTTNASKIQETTGTITYGIYKQSQIDAGYYSSNTFYAKSAGRDWIAFNALDGSNNLCWFNLSNGTLGTVPIGLTASIVPSINGFYKITVTKVSFGAAQYFSIIPTTGNNISTYTGDGTSGFYLYGCQREVGTYATSYIPTISTTVTRNDDVISKSGISTLIGQTEGTIYWDGTPRYGDSGYYNIFNILRNYDYSKSIFLGIQSNGLIQIVSQTVPSENSSVAIPLNQKIKIALRYKDNDWALYLNGVQVWSKSALVPSGTFDILEEQYGGPYLSTNKASEHILYKTALTDEECIVLTTI